MFQAKMLPVSGKANGLRDDPEESKTSPKQNPHEKQEESSTDSCQSYSNEIPPSMLSAGRQIQNLMEMIGEIKEYQDTDTSTKDVVSSEIVSYPLGETSTLLSSVLSSVTEMSATGDIESDKPDANKDCRFQTNDGCTNSGARHGCTKDENEQNKEYSCKIEAVCTDTLEPQENKAKRPEHTNEEDRTCGTNKRNDACSCHANATPKEGEKNDKNPFNIVSSCPENEKKVRICQCSHQKKGDNLFNKKRAMQDRNQLRDQRATFLLSCGNEEAKTDEKAEYTCVDFCRSCVEGQRNLHMSVPFHMQPSSYCRPYANFPLSSCRFHGNNGNNIHLLCNKNRYHKMHVQHISAPTPAVTEHTDIKCRDTCRGPKRLYRRLVRLPRRKRRKQRSCDDYYCRLLSTTDKCPASLSKPKCIEFQAGIENNHSTPCPGILKNPCDDFTSEPLRERVDIYYFDHGNSGYYRTTDRPPPTKADLVLESTEEYVTQFWADIFGYIHIAFAFIIHFLLQLLRFLLLAIIRPLTVGAIQLVSDYLLKPLLSILFNGVIQPVLILAYNIATSFKDLCLPIARAVGYFLREVAVVVRSLRLVEVHNFKQQRCV